jgi:hypothetical protein
MVVGTDGQVKHRLFALREQPNAVSANARRLI